VNTYRAIFTDAGYWTVEWSASGVVLGNVSGRFPTEAEAMFATFEAARAEAMKVQLK
jgi:hypothetical protein